MPDAKDLAIEALTKVNSLMRAQEIANQEFRDSIKAIYGLLWASVGGIGLLLIGEIIQLISHGKVTL